MRAAILLLVLALPAAAADPFAGLKRLDRVTVTDQDGDTVSGIVRSILRGRLSLQIEGREGLTGSLVFERKAVRTVEKTGTATEEELKAASQPPAPPPEGFVEPEPHASGAPPAPAPPRPVLEVFPTATWSMARRDEIASKDAYLRSTEERQFLSRFDEWLIALLGDQREHRHALLKRFPPAEGWSRTRYGQLRQVFCTIGRVLTNDESDFVRSFEEWELALKEDSNVDLKTCVR